MEALRVQCDLACGALLRRGLRRLEAKYPPHERAAQRRPRRFEALVRRPPTRPCGRIGRSRTARRRIRLRRRPGHRGAGVRRTPAAFRWDPASCGRASRAVPSSPRASPAPKGRQPVLPRELPRGSQRDDDRANDAEDDEKRQAVAARAASFLGRLLADRRRDGAEVDFVAEAAFIRVSLRDGGRLRVLDAALDGGLRGRGAELDPTDAREVDLGPGVRVLLRQFVRRVLRRVLRERIDDVSRRYARRARPACAASPPSPTRGSRSSRAAGRTGSSRSCRGRPACWGRRSRWGTSAGSVRASPLRRTGSPHRRSLPRPCVPTRSGRSSGSCR